MHSRVETPESSAAFTNRGGGVEEHPVGRLRNLCNLCNLRSHCSRDADKASSSYMPRKSRSMS